MEAASSTLKPVILELGGKDPFIVLDPCDLETAVDRAINGSFFNLGQNCISAERVIVQRSLYPRFVELVGERMRHVRQGVDADMAPIDFGSMTMSAQLDKALSLIQDAVKHGGAKLVSGGVKRLLVTNNGGSGGGGGGGGLFLAPTVLADVNERCRLWREEAFGPVMLLIPVEDEHEAITVANSSRFGLGASVACTDLGKAERVAKALENGMVVINDYGLSYMIQDLPFGGWKDSGFGRFNGPEGLREFCNVKSFVGQRWNVHGSLGFPQFMRRPLWVHTSDLLNEVLVVFYGWGVLAKISAVGSILKLILGKKMKKNNKSD
jgi:acyl-CoA reductase-like NAD-dependent aldehyde dehydrogenase